MFMFPPYTNLVQEWALVYNPHVVISNNNKFYSLENTMEQQPLKRVHKTEKKDVSFRGKLVNVEQPEIGSIVAIRDSRSTFNGPKKSAVVVRLWKSKTGVVQTVELWNIREISPEEITPGEYFGKLFLYINSGWARWDEIANPDESDHYYEWDEYINEPDRSSL
jgi:hypothetical protein